MRGLVFATVAAALLIPAGTALAAPPDGPGPWADFVQDFSQGTQKDGDPVAPERSDPSQALGPAERTDEGTGTFVEGTFFTLGMRPPGSDPSTPGGHISLGYENPVCNGSGADFDIELVETTKEPHPPQLVDVFVSNDGVNYTKIADEVEDDELVALPGNIERVQFVRLVDVTRPEDHPSGDADGYDVDGVQALDTTSCVPPEPEGEFSCRASALRVGLLNNLEPFVANEGRVPCRDDQAGLIPPTALGPVFVAVLFAATDEDPGDQPGGQATAGAAFLRIGAAPNVIQVAALNSTATVRCVNGEPDFSGSSEVVGLVVGPQSFSGSDPATIDLGPLGKIFLNEQVESNTQLTQRALRYEGPLMEIVVGESIADVENDPCG